MKNHNISNLDHEFILLSSLIFNPDMRYLAHELSENDFHLLGHSQIFALMKPLIDSRQDFTLPSLANLMAEKSSQQCLGILTKMYNSYPSVGHLKSLVDELKRFKRFRDAQMLMLTKLPMFENISDKTDLELQTLVDELRKLSFDYKRKKLSTTVDYATKGYEKPIEHGMIAEFQTRQAMKAEGMKVIAGYPTHFADIDKIFDGFQAGHLTYIAARPGVGKTTFMLNLAERMAVQNGLKVGIFSLEMTGLELTEKIYLARADLSHRRAKRGEVSSTDIHQLYGAVRELEGHPMMIDDTSMIRIADLSHRAKAWRELEKVDIIFIDYVQLISPTDARKSKYESTTEISQKLKILAKELNIPVVSLAQLNRESDRPGIQKPKVSDLRDSGALEQDADEIFLLANNPDNANVLKVYLAKNRFGECGEFELQFMKDLGKLNNLYRREVEDDSYFPRR